MPNHLKRPTTGLLLSGGLDSAILLDQLLGRGWHVVPFFVRTGCAWDEYEIAAVHRFLSAMPQSGLDELVLLDMPVADLYGNHWSVSGESVPNDCSPDEAVFMPGRNPLLLIKPVLWCQMHGIGQVALATLQNNPFDDATPEFFARFEAMIHQATGDAVRIVRPFEHMPKQRVLALGRHLPLELTFSCLAPVDGMHCGTCNKCGERRAAFRSADIEDRTRYAKGESPPPRGGAVISGIPASR